MQPRVASSVLRYGFRTTAIMLRTYRDQRPLRLCATIAALFSVIGIAFLGWSYSHVVQTGSWLKWAARTS